MRADSRPWERISSAEACRTRCGQCTLSAMTLDLFRLLKLCRDDIWQTTSPKGRPGARGIKLARHADPKWDLKRILREGHFHDYQSRQADEVFKGAELVIALMGEHGSRSRFLGVYRVRGVAAEQRPYLPGYPFPDMGMGKYWYDLEHLDGFEELEDRLVVDWGTGMRSWTQWLDPEKPKDVIELYPKGHVLDFPGYSEVLLTFEELVKMVTHPDANRTWHKAMSGVAGVYLIADGVTGEQYVGSAYGQDGILGRWKTYAQTPHGGNVLLKAILEATPNRVHGFRFSVLQTLPRTMTKGEVVRVETAWKEKLGTRAFGLNSN